MRRPKSSIVEFSRFIYLHYWLARQQRRASPYLLRHAFQLLVIRVLGRYATSQADVLVRLSRLNVHERGPLHVDSGKGILT